MGSGPRQIGKTPLAKALVPAPGYLRWDIPEQRELILRREIPPVDAIVLDEIHKYRSWRQYLKGLYDQHGDRLRILVAALPPVHEVEPEVTVRRELNEPPVEGSGDARAHERPGVDALPSPRHPVVAADR